MTVLLSVLADATPSPSPTAPPIDPSRVTPGLLGLISFLFLVVAVVLLYRSMQKQIKKVRPDLPDGPADTMRAEDRRIIDDAEQRGASGGAADGGADRPAD
jgi:hypothetical protein